MTPGEGNIMIQNIDFEKVSAVSVKDTVMRSNG